MYTCKLFSQSNNVWEAFFSIHLTHDLQIFLRQATILIWGPQLIQLYSLICVKTRYQCFEWISDKRLIYIMSYKHSDVNIGAPGWSRFHLNVCYITVFNLQKWPDIRPAKQKVLSFIRSVCHKVHNSTVISEVHHWPIVRLGTTFSSRANGGCPQVISWCFLIHDACIISTLL